MYPKKESNYRRKTILEQKKIDDKKLYDNVFYEYVDEVEEDKPISKPKRNPLTKHIGVMDSEEDKLVSKPKSNPLTKFINMIDFEDDKPISKSNRKLKKSIVK